MKKRCILALLLAVLLLSLAGCGSKSGSGEANSQIIAKLEKANGELFVGVNFNMLNYNIDKRMRSSYNDVTITYESSDPAVLSHDGIIHPTDKDESLILYTHLTCDGVTITKERQVTVLASSADALAKTLLEGYDLSALVTDLPKAGAYGKVTVSYRSSDEAVLSSAGKAFPGEAPKTVELTAIFTSDVGQVQQTYTVTVPRHPLLDANNALFAQVDRANVTDHVAFPRELPDGVHAEYISLDPRTMSHTGKIIRGNKDKTVTVEVTLTKGGVTLVTDHQFTVKAISLVNKFPRTYDDPTVYSVNAGNFTDLLAEKFRDPENCNVRSITVDFDGESAYLLADFERFADLYGLTYENLDLQGDSADLVNRRKVKLTAAYYGYDSMPVEPTAQWTWYYIPNMNTILRQREAMDKGTFRSADFDDFKLYDTGKGTKEVLLPFDLVEAVAAGYTPTFPVANTRAEYYYECAKNILRDIITDDMTDLQKTTAIMEYLGECANYDNDSFYHEGTQGGDSDTLRYTCYYLDGFFESGRVVCNGFCDVMTLMCALEGIPAVEVQGVGGWGHAWMQMKIGDKWAVFCPTGANGRNEQGTYANGVPFIDVAVTLYGKQTNFVHYANFNRETAYMEEDFPDISPRPQEVAANGLTESKMADVFRESALFGTDLYIETQEELEGFLQKVWENRISDQFIVAFCHPMDLHIHNTVKTFFGAAGLTEAYKESGTVNHDGDYIIDQVSDEVTYAAILYFDLTNL